MVILNGATYLLLPLHSSIPVGLGVGWEQREPGRWDGDGDG